MLDGGRPSEPTTLLTRQVELVVDDAEEAGAVGSRLFYPQQLSVLGRPRGFAMTLRGARLGPVFLGENSFDADVRISCGELSTSYHVNMPLEGRLASRHRGTDVEATPERAALYGPLGETVLSRWESGCRQLCVKIERGAVDAALAAHLGREVVGPVTLDPSLDLRHGAGRSWAQLARMINEQLRQPDSLLYQPMVAAPLAHGLLTGLLTAASHELRAALASPAPAAQPPMLRRAIDYIEAHATLPITTADVAAHCNMSVRALQEGFARHLGQTPTHYLRAVRLRGAHHDLLTSSPFESTVATVSHRWGFTHLGRFAAAHQAAFGELPSTTLQRGE